MCFSRRDKPCVVKFSIVDDILPLDGIGRHAECYVNICPAKRFACEYLLLHIGVYYLFNCLDLTPLIQCHERAYTAICLYFTIANNCDGF